MRALVRTVPRVALRRHRAFVDEGIADESRCSIHIATELSINDFQRHRPTSAGDTHQMRCDIKRKTIIIEEKWILQEKHIQ